MKTNITIVLCGLLALLFMACETPIKRDFSGNWQVTIGEITYPITLLPDSTLIDPVFNAKGHWRVKSDTSSFIQFFNEEEGYRIYKMTSVTDSIITINGSIRLQKIKTPSNQTLSAFGKLVGILNDAFLVPVKSSLSSELIHSYIPEIDNVTGGGILLQDQNRITAYFNPYGKTALVVLDKRTERVSDKKIIEEVPGECTAMISLVQKGSYSLINSSFVCIEGEPINEYLEVTEKGEFAAFKVPDYFDEGYVYTKPLDDNTDYPTPSGGNSLTRDNVNQLLTAFFQRSANSGWEHARFRTENQINLQGLINAPDENPEFSSFGMFMAGSGSITDFIWSQWQNSNLAKKEDCFWNCYLEDLSGIKLYISTATEGRNFNELNPEFIKWLYTNFIPEPSSFFFSEITYQDLYVKVFRRAARLHTLAYCHLKTYNWNEALNTFKEAAQQDGFDGRIYLRERYSKALPFYCAKGYEDTTLSPALAIGFWLRRGLDNTDKECWLGLQKAMKKYDAAWYKQTMQEYGFDQQ